MTVNQTDMVVDFGATETSSNLSITAGDVKRWRYNSRYAELSRSRC